jgi:GT2 family glycosyltransferase
MIYTIILDHEKSHHHTKNLISNINEHPYEVINSSIFKTSFTESFNIAIKNALKTSYNHIMICNNDISLNADNLDNLNYIIDDKIGIYSPMVNSPHVKVMNRVGHQSIRNIYWLEFIAPIFHRNVLDKVGLLDSRMSYGWGVELDYCYRANLQRYYSYLIQDVEIEHFEHQSQDNHDQYCHEANIEMNHVLATKYGPDWQSILKFPQW